jgi:hypothetical protein
MHIIAGSPAEQAGSHPAFTAQHTANRDDKPRSARPRASVAANQPVECNGRFCTDMAPATLPPYPDYHLTRQR